MTAEMVIQTQKLGRRFGSLWAVRGASLEVPRGSITAFVGRNGAGKTTLIRMLLDLLAPSEGTLQVLGLDPVREGAAVRARTGYVAEGQTLFPWMKVGRFLEFISSFYETWDRDLARSMAERFELPLGKRIRTLSRGMRAQLALVAGLAHRPELLVLDEPTAGLDVVVRRQFLEGVIDLIQQEGRTVFISSHIVEDLERVADRMVVIHKGCLVLQQDITELRERMKKVRLIPKEKSEGPLSLPEGWRVISQNGRSLELEALHYEEGDLGRVTEGISLASDPEVEPLSFEEMFLASVRSGEEGRDESR
jgi:ABC-2 type transport system ATP-binding protein